MGVRAVFSRSGDGVTWLNNLVNLCFGLTQSALAANTNNIVDKIQATARFNNNANGQRSNHDGGPV